MYMYIHFDNAIPHLHVPVRVFWYNTSHCSLQVHVLLYYHSSLAYTLFIKKFCTVTSTTGNYWPSSFQLCMSQPRVKPCTSPRYTGTVQFCPMKQAMMSVPPVQVQYILYQANHCLYSNWATINSYIISQKNIQNSKNKTNMMSLINKMIPRIE